MVCTICYEIMSVCKVLGGTYSRLAPFADREPSVLSVEPKSPQYSRLKKRVASFSNWPRDISQTPQEFAEAGFFYTGTNDIVRCYVCDGGLQKWGSGDSVWVEHARWFPRCPYLRQVKGEHFIQRIRLLSEQREFEKVAPNSVLDKAKRMDKTVKDFVNQEGLDYSIKGYEHGGRKKKSYQQPITAEFQKKYANIVLELDNLNKDLNEYLIGVQQYSQEIAPEQGLKPIDEPSEIRQRCDEEGEGLVAKVSKNMFANKVPKNDSMMMLIEKLTSLMLQIRTFSENELNSFEYKSLQGAMSEIKEGLDQNNINAFKNNVEIHINHIQSGLSQTGNLHAFSSTNFTV